MVAVVCVDVRLAPSIAVSESERWWMQLVSVHVSISLAHASSVRSVD